MPISAPMLEMFSAWLEPVREQLPPDLSLADASALQQAITAEALSRFGAFLSGVRAYQSFDGAREEPADVRLIWQRGTTRLLDYAPQAKGPVLLVVPSLVNRFEILDIDPDHSFLRFLVRCGFRPLVIDWQEPGEEEKAFDLTAYIRQRLQPALDEACALQGGACHVLGYCMGGVMALALAALCPQQARSLVLMAAPWDFSFGVGGVPPATSPMGQAFIEQAQQLSPALEPLGELPAACLQALFTAFQPLQILQKFARFAGSAVETETMRRFVLTEDWLNDGVPLALKVAGECLRDWYIGNLPAKGEWRVDGQPIRPEALDLPTYILIAGKDRIVPPESTRPLAGLIRGAVLHEPSIGHIGLMTGDAAPQKAWIPLVKWLAGLGV